MMLQALLLMIIFGCARSDYCQPSQTCWPTTEDLNNLAKDLDTTIKRTIYWDGDPNPIPAALIASPVPSDQPLYGAGADLKPVYVAEDSSKICFADNYFTEFCKVTARDLPNSFYPKIAVFPVSASQVQTAVRFANKHNIQVCVTGTGADYKNRHNCDGMLIRTTLLKSFNWNLDPGNSFGNVAGVVTMGSGFTWEEVHKSASLNNRVISSGWCGTVGIGWMLGGGHGPFENSLGNGPDNVLATDVVLADGSLVHADSKQNTDIFWAIRGGGGSAFGIIVSITVKAHYIPSGGFMVVALGKDGMSSQDLKNWVDVLLTLGSKWSGYGSISTTVNGFNYSPNYVYMGSATDPEYVATVGRMTALLTVHAELSFLNSYDLVYAYNTKLCPACRRIYANDYTSALSTSYDIASPSALVMREDVNKMVDFFTSIQNTCVTSSGTNCLGSISICQDITGNIGAAQPTGSSLSPGMRSALFHVYSTGTVFPKALIPKIHAIGKYSYFGESAYYMSDWPTRYWGDENYKRLLSIKHRIDPDGRIWCEHCVGDISGVAQPTSSPSSKMAPTLSPSSKGNENAKKTDKGSGKVEPKSKSGKGKDSDKGKGN